MTTITCIKSFNKCTEFFNECVDSHPKYALITAVACAALGIASGGILASIAVTSAAVILLASTSFLSFAISATLFVSYAQQSSSPEEDPDEPEACEESHQQDTYTTNRNELIEVMHQTLRDLKKGFYEHNGINHELNVQSAIDGVESVEYLNAAFHIGPYHTRIRVVSEDCLDVAQDLYNNRLNPLVLDLANAHEPGGGYLRGCRAQEETICRRSTLGVAIDSYHGMQPHNFYPLNPSETSAAGLYVPAVTVFRDKNYQYLDKPFPIALAVIAARKNPPLQNVSGEWRLSDADAEIVRRRIRTTLEMAYRNRHESVVLGALGCGAFCNPPKHIAEIFHEVIDAEYDGCFKEIVFAILDDHNAGHDHNPEGNFLPFKNTFDPN